MAIRIIVLFIPFLFFLEIASLPVETTKEDEELSNSKPSIEDILNPTLYSEEPKFEEESNSTDSSLLGENVEMKEILNSTNSSLVQSEWRRKYKIANWWSSFDRKGWSFCARGYYMQGLWRNGGGHQIYRLEQALCLQAPYRLRPTTSMRCYRAKSWWGSFDKKGWSTCAHGFYMRGLYRNGGGHQLYRIEEAYCCKPRNQKRRAGYCYRDSVWGSFDTKGWSRCLPGYYMAGLWRNKRGCEGLYCIEEFKCCRMGDNKFG